MNAAMPGNARDLTGWTTGSMFNFQLGDVASLGITIRNLPVAQLFSDDAGSRAISLTKGV
jgi:hypothetical protein